MNKQYSNCFSQRHLVVNVTIHVELNGFAPPCVYVLLPNKTEKFLAEYLVALTELGKGFENAEV